KSGFDLSWNIKYDQIERLQREGFTLSIAYDTKLNAKRFKKGYTNTGWETIKGIDLKETAYSVKELEGDEKYVFRIGLDDGENVYWSEENTIKTEQSWGLFSFLVLIGSLAMFLYGMKIMSDGLQQAAGSRLRNLLG